MLVTLETPSKLFLVAVFGLILLLFIPETPSELFPVTVSGLAGILLFGVLLGLLELSLLELSGEHGHLFFISLNVFFHYILSPTIMLTIKVWWSNYGLSFKHAL